MTAAPIEVLTKSEELRARRTIRLPGGERFAFFEAGAGDDVLLIHGATLTSHDMRASLFEPLAERFHVVAIDRPGHGLSTRPAGDGSLARQAELVTEGVRELGLKRPWIVGHSIGGALAIELALDAPDLVSGVLAINPIAFPEPRLEQAIFGPRAMLRFGGLGPRAPRGLDAAALPLLWRAIFHPQRPPARFEREMAFDEVSTPGGMTSVGEDALALGLDLARNAFRYGACEPPVEILLGGADVVVNPRLHGRMLARLLPDARLTILPGLGHMLHHFEAGFVSAIAAARAERLGAATGPPGAS